MKQVKIKVIVDSIASHTVILGDVANEAFETLIKDEIYSRKEDGSFSTQGGFSEAEHIAIKLGRAGFDVRLEESPDNRLRLGTIRWLTY